ncbi:MAG TPA: response regulator, partial [Nitrospirota bacterium]
MDILLIDDDASFLQSLAEGLAGLHAKRRLNVVTADNGKKAIQMLRTALFDAVLTDLNLPV